MGIYENGFIGAGLNKSRGAYRDCKWCHGQGCLQCEVERRKAAPELPEPIFTAHFDNPAEMKILKECFGREAIDHAFGPGGDGVREIETNVVLAQLKQHVKTTGA